MNVPDNGENRTNAIDLPMIHQKSQTPQRIEKSPDRLKKRHNATKMMDEHRVSRNEMLLEETKTGESLRGGSHRLT